MSSKAEGERVEVRVTGDVTGREYAGAFRVKTSLSHAERLTMDRVRRELIGGPVGSPGPEALEAAWMLSRLAVRVIDAPAWWSDSAVDGIGGLGLHDDNVVSEVFNEVMKKDVRVARELERQAELARKKLAEQPTE